MMPAGLVQKVVDIDLAGAVLDGVPIDEAAITGIAHDAADKSAHTA